MNTLNVHADPDRDEDDDDFGDVEARPLLGWFLMAVALVTMAFLIGGHPDASAGQVVTVAPHPAAEPPALAATAAPDATAFGG